MENDQKVRQLEGDIASLKSAMQMQDLWLMQLGERIGRCEEMAGINPSAMLPIASIASLETPVIARPRSLSDQSTSSTASKSMIHSIKMETRTRSRSQSAALAQQSFSPSSNAVDESSPTSSSAKKRKSTHRPCTYPGGCERLAHGPDYKYCLRHGGGYRCQVDGCSRSAYSTRYCSRHGGGPRCQFPSCGKGAISNSSFCRRHGGGPRCQHPNCNEGARIGYSYCLAHGGYNPCGFPSCPCPALHTSNFCRQHNSYHKKVDTNIFNQYALPNLTN